MLKGNEFRSITSFLEPLLISPKEPNASALTPLKPTAASAGSSCTQIIWGFHSGGRHRPELAPSARRISVINKIPEFCFRRSSDLPKVSLTYMF